jgi:hypothetical protein
MTRRERLERKVERRHDWAQGRREKAQSDLAFASHFTGDIAFNTQPGHFPLRAKVIRAEDRAYANLNMAEHHEEKAAGLEAQLTCTVFSDDANAIEALESRIAENEAKRERMKLVNKFYKKGDAIGLSTLGINLETLTAKLAASGPYWGSAPHLPYEMTNLGARIREDKKRIETIKARNARTEKAEANGGVVIEVSRNYPQYCSVTFAEKPDREILDALRNAGFRWGGGSWSGDTEKLPDSVKALSGNYGRITELQMQAD